VESMIDRKELKIRVKETEEGRNMIRRKDYT
jgi:hypothetical protein